MHSLVLRGARSIALALLLTSMASVAWATTLDAPTVTAQAEGYFKVRLTIAAGPSGAPGGFTLLWMRRVDWIANGGWSLDGHPAQFEASFHGQPTLNVFPGDAETFRLGNGESITVEIGDLADESGVAHISDILDPNTRYVFTAFANEWMDAEGHWERSTLAANVFARTTINPNCTQGYWKTHGPAPCVQGNNANEWPVTSLMLGTTNYTDLELCSIFQESPSGNGLISLAHQLIAAEFNLALGADPSCIEMQVAAAHALINGLVVPPVGGGFLHPSDTAALTQALDDFNNGLLCQAHNCEPVSVEATTWGAVKSLYR